MIQNLRAENGFDGSIFVEIRLILKAIIFASIKSLFETSRYNNVLRQFFFSNV